MTVGSASYVVPQTAMTTLNNSIRFTLQSMFLSSNMSSWKHYQQQTGTLSVLWITIARILLTISIVSIAQFCETAQLLTHSSALDKILSEHQNPHLYPFNNTDK